MYRCWISFVNRFLESRSKRISSTLLTVEKKKKMCFINELKSDRRYKDYYVGYRKISVDPLFLSFLLSKTILTHQANRRFASPTLTQLLLDSILTVWIQTILKVSTPRVLPTEGPGTSLRLEENILCLRDNLPLLSLVFDPS